MLAKAAPLFILVLLPSSLSAQDNLNPLVNVPRRASPPPAEILEFLHEGNHEKLSKIAGGLEECLAVSHPDVQVSLTNLDQDEELEAVIACVGIGDAKAIVLDPHEKKWFVVARLSAWLNYEREPLAVFIQERDLGEGQGADLLVRSTITHGSGVYERQMAVYRMNGMSFREILRLPKELSDWFGWSPGVCQISRQTIFQQGATAGDRAKAAIVVRTYEAELPLEKCGDPSIDSDRLNPGLWKQFQVVECKGYSWSIEGFRFVVDPEVTSRHCVEKASPEVQP